MPLLWQVDALMQGAQSFGRFVIQRLKIEGLELHRIGSCFRRRLDVITGRLETAHVIGAYFSDDERATSSNGFGVAESDDGMAAHFSKTVTGSPCGPVVGMSLTT